MIKVGSRVINKENHKKYIVIRMVEAEDMFSFGLVASRCFVYSLLREDTMYLQHKDIRLCDSIAFERYYELDNTLMETE